MIARAHAPRLWAVAAFFLVLTFLWCGPILTDPAHVTGDVGDPLHMAWVMAWVGHQVVRHPLELFNSNNFYPYKNSLAFGDHLLPEGLLALPINLITGNAVLALNLVTGFGLLTSALAAFFLVSRLLDNRAAGLVAGTVLMFNSFIQSELLRVNVLQLQGWCLGLLLLWRFVEKPSWPTSILFALAVGIQGLTGTYYAVYSAFLVPLFVVAAYSARRRAPCIVEFVRLAAPSLVVGVIGFLFLSPYRVSASQSLAQKPIPDGADIASFFLPGKEFWLLGGVLPFAPKGESNHFLGYIPLLLAAIGVMSALRNRSTTPPVRRFLIFSAAILIAIGAFISIGGYPRFMGAPLGTSPYLAVLNAAPLLRGMATVERAAVLIQIGVALLAGLGAETFLRERSASALAFAIASLCAAEQWTRPGPGFRVPTGSELPEVYRFLAKDQGPVVELPVFPDRLLRFRALYPYFSTSHWRPVPLGRASFYPPAHDYFAMLLQGFPDDLSMAALREMKIRDIVVHPRMWENRRAGRLRTIDGSDFQLLKSFPGDAPEGAARSLDMGDERVYRVPSESGAMSVCRPSQELNRAALTITSSARDGLDRLRDNELDTSWSTVGPQKEGDVLEVHWTDERPLAAIQLDLGSRPSHYPVALRVDIQDGAGVWQEVAPLQPVDSAMETLRELIHSDPKASRTIRIPPIQTRAVRLRVGKDESRPGWNPWSVAEIHLYSECSNTARP
ncbi:MAG: hypothetical protein ABIR28_00215 [Vicinamibacteria bacterium]